jgi:hypothetical protein
MIEPEFSRAGQQSSPSPLHRDVGVCHWHTPPSDEILWRKIRRFQMENVMRGRVMMILASAVLAGSLLATDAQARGGGGGGHGGGFGGGHMGGGFGGGHIGGFGGGHLGGFGGGHMAGMRGEHSGGGRRHFARGGLYDDGLGCPYYQTYTSPYTCDY